MVEITALGEAIMLGLRPFIRYWDFNGRTGRAEYWQFFVLFFLVGSLISLVEMRDAMQGQALGLVRIPIYSSIFALLTFLPASAVTFRRLHDRNKSGWLAGSIPLVVVAIVVLMMASTFVTLTPVIVSLYLILAIITVYVLVQLALPGDEFDNEFGPMHEEEPGSFNLFGNAARAFTSYERADVSRPDDTISRVERLAELHARGHLTDEEFASQKSILFGDS